MVSLGDGNDIELRDAPDYLQGELAHVVRLVSGYDDVHNVRHAADPERVVDGDLAVFSRCPSFRSLILHGFIKGDHWKFVEDGQLES